VPDLRASAQDVHLMTSKRDHYLSQVYLRQFTNPERKKELWEFDLDSGQVKASSPKESGFEYNYHSFTNEDGTRDEKTVQQALWRIENRLPAVYEAIRHRRGLSIEDWTTVCLTAALFRTQSPKTVTCFKESLTEMFQMHKEMASRTPEFRALCDEEHVTIEEVRSIKFTPDHGWTVLAGLNQLANQTRLLGRMRWHFLRAPLGTFFVTSDDPVCCWAPTDKRGLWGAVGPANTHVEITFPLSKGVCAFANWQHAPSALYETLQAKAVDAINLRTVLNGCRYVFGPSHNAEIQSLILKLANEPSQTS
jgi:hypothetical protein